MKYLFVYGTLKNNKGLLKDCTFIATVNTHDIYEMYLSLGSLSYPALVQDDNGRSIKGELYEVPDSTIKLLDQYEDAPYLFKLEEIELQDSGDAYFSELKVYTYIYQKSTDNMEKSELNYFKID